MLPLQRPDPDRVGPYRLLGRLGAGGMGVVYLGRSPSGRPVAIKVIQRRFAGQPRFAARFRREVAAARRVTGVFTAPVLDADPDAAAPWLATAYLPGLTLREVVTRFGPLPPAAVRPLAAGLAEALGEIHRAGVVHRDLKPGNVMLTAGGPRVIDFGISRPEDSVTITRANSTVGTPGFMAPEQLRAEKTGPPADVFVLGSTLAYAATGREPFGDGALESRDLRVLHGRADLGAIAERWLLDLIRACLRPEPERRPTAAGVLELLGPADDGAPSLLGTRWLPAAVAEEIDRCSAEAAAPRGPAPRPAAGDLGLDSAVTTDTGSGEGPVTRPPAAGTARRTLLAGAGAALLTMTGFGTLLWRLAGDDPGDDDVRSATWRTGTAAGPPPEGVSRWKRRVTESRLELFAAGGVLLANGSDEKGEKAHVRALDPRTGKVLWSREGASASRPYEDVAYLSFDRAAKVGAVRAATGEALWTHDVPFDVDGGGTGDIVATGQIVAYGTQKITGLDPSTGRRRWETRPGGRVTLFAAGGLLLAVAETALLALDAATGRTRWKYPLDYGDFPVAADGMVFAVDRFGTQHAVRAGTGAPAWKLPNAGGWGGQAGGGRLYTEARRDGEVLALDAATGRRIWSRALLARPKDDPRAQATALCLAGPTLYVGCTDDVLYALDPADGRIQWTYGADKPAAVQPVSTGGLVILGAPDGHVRAVAPPSAQPNPNGGPRATP